MVVVSTFHATSMHDGLHERAVVAVAVVAHHTTSRARHVSCSEKCRRIDTRTQYQPLHKPHPYPHQHKILYNSQQLLPEDPNILRLMPNPPYCSYGLRMSGIVRVGEGEIGAGDMRGGLPSTRGGVGGAITKNSSRSMKPIQLRRR